jgi:hypothetical protein
VQSGRSLNGLFYYLVVATINDFIATCSEEMDAVVLKPTSCGVIPNDVTGISAEIVLVQPAAVAGIA